MLHALLKGKLRPETPDVERLEDALTSAVIGSLVLAQAWDALDSWLGSAQSLCGRWHPPASPSNVKPQAWFWPWLGQTEPDVVLVLPSATYVVEAKHRSGRHDLRRDSDGAEEERTRDQLVRQFEDVCTIRARGRIDDPLLAALTIREVRFVYVVDGRRRARALAECKESHAAPPCGTEPWALGLTTWQRLHTLLLKLGDPKLEPILQYAERLNLVEYRGHFLLADAAEGARAVKEMHFNRRRKPLMELVPEDMALARDALLRWRPLEHRGRSIWNHWSSEFDLDALTRWTFHCTEERPHE